MSPPTWSTCAGPWTPPPRPTPTWSAFPELSLSGYLLRATDYTADLLDDVERAERVLAADARRLAVTAIYGAPVRGPGRDPAPVRGPGRGLRNAVILQEPDGRRLVYDKTHLVAKEREVFVPGNEFVVDDRGIGLACCYDLAFPEAIRVVTLQGREAAAGADGLGGGRLVRDAPADGGPGDRERRLRRRHQPVRNRG